MKKLKDRFIDNPEITLDQAQNHLAVLQICDQRAPDIIKNITDTKAKIDELIFAKEHEETGRSGAT